MEKRRVKRDRGNVKDLTSGGVTYIETRPTHLGAAIVLTRARKPSCFPAISLAVAAGRCV